MPQKLTRRQALLLALAGTAGIGAFGMHGSRNLRVNRQTLELHNWKHAGLRVVQISDVHVNDAAQTKTAIEAVELVLAEKPDLIVFTGDFVNYSTPDCLSNIPIAFKALEGASCPCLAVLGNHDYWSGGVESIIAKVKETPLRLLRNETIDFQGVSICGLDDGLSGTPDWKLPQEGSLVLLHEPDFVRSLPDHAGLMLAGHSHGGEICLPGGIPLYTPYGSKSYKSGFYDRLAVPLFVSHGTATLGPARCFCPAEINVLTLNSA